MDLECSQIGFSACDLDKSREFYVAKLGLTVVESHPKMFAVRAGSVRLSVFGGGTAPDPEEEVDSMMLMLRTADLGNTMAELSDNGIEFEGEVMEAPGFMKHVGLLDPDGRQLYICEYMRDPLQPV